MIILLATAMLCATEPASNILPQEQVITKADVLIEQADKIAILEAEITNLKASVVNLEAKQKERGLQDIYSKILFLRPNLNKSIAKDIAKIVKKHAEEDDIDIDLVLSIIRLESYFDLKAISSTGARGLMQIMLPFWEEDCSINKKNMYDAETNINCGIIALTTYYQKYNNIYLALTAYNSGDQVVDYLLTHHRKINYGYARVVRYYYQQLKSIQSPLATDTEKKLLGF